MNPSISDIKNATCAYYKPHRITRDDLEGQSRYRRVVRPRQVCMYVSMAMTTHSLQRIGRAFGNRDHTTVIHARRTVEAREEYLEDAERVAQIVRARGPIRYATGYTVASELEACQSIAYFLRGLPPRPAIKRNWIRLESVEA